jgi:hypothetical protein
MADNYAKHVSFEIFLLLVHRNENEPIIDVTGVEKREAQKQHSIWAIFSASAMPMNPAVKKLLEKLKLV